MTQINQLEENPSVASVSKCSIQHTTEFKVKAVRENIEGKGPQKIYTETGFDLTVIGKRKTQSVRVESLAPNVPKKRRVGSPERYTWKCSGRRTPEGRRVDGETVGEGRGTDQIFDGRERALKKAREFRMAGETYELGPAEKYPVINTVIRIAQLKNLVRPLCEIA